jgi:hypothetical protein
MPAAAPQPLLSAEIPNEDMRRDLEAKLCVEEYVNLIIGPDESEPEEKRWSWSLDRFGFRRPIRRSLRIGITS